VWASYDAAHRRVRVVVLNKDLKAHGAASIRIPRARGTGVVKRLLAPTASSYDHITWGGQSFPLPTDPADLTGPRRLQRVRRHRGDRYRFDMPAASAALLTVAVRRRH
jgi:hypothetical protein